MFESIVWVALLKVANERKVTTILRRFSEAADCEMTLDGCERYWKDKSLFHVVFTSPLGADSVSEAVFQTLRICQKVLPKWTVSGPHDYADERWEFSGSSMNLAEGITMIDFRVDNFSTV